MNYYSVYDNRSESIVAFGNARECSEYLNIKVGSFYYAISRQKRRKKEGRYTIIVEKIREFVFK